MLLEFAEQEERPASAGRFFLLVSYGCGASDEAPSHFSQKMTNSGSHPRASRAVIKEHPETDRDSAETTRPHRNNRT